MSGEQGWHRRQAIQIAASLPENTEDARSRYLLGPESSVVSALEETGEVAAIHMMGHPGSLDGVRPIVRSRLAGEQALYLGRTEKSPDDETVLGVAF